MSVGLQPPDDFWKAVGTLTAKMKPKDKIYFLADIVSAFGDNMNPSLEESMFTLFPQMLEQVNYLRRTKYHAKLTLHFTIRELRW
jgi:hypothetical protein